MLGNTSDQMNLIPDAKQIEEYINNVFQGMRQAALKDPNPTWQTRFNRLERLENMILSNRIAIEDAINQDFSQRSDFVSSMVDVMPALVDIRVMKKHGESWMKPRRVSPDWYFLPASAKIIPQPKGVVGVIAPWNYPLLLSFGPASQALAAGNLVMVKLSEYTPTFGALMEKLTHKYFHPDELVVIPGAPGTGAIFSEVPFDQILFTGSPHTGKLVMGAAAKNLTPVILELGGKSPAVIAPGYPLDRAAERIMYGKLLNSGQTCISPDYVLLEEGSLQKFAAACKTVANKFYPKGVADPDYCSIITMKRFEEVLDQLRTCPGNIVESLFDGEQIDTTHRKIGPQLLLNPSLDNVFMKEEIFGPVLPLIPYPENKPEEALEFIALRPHPLAAYWFDNDKKRKQNAMRIIKTGGITVNDTIWHAVQTRLPFGGIGNSGMGRYNGKRGFESFSNMKPVFIQSRFDFVKLADPPYSSKFRDAIRAIITKSIFGGKPKKAPKQSKTKS